MRVFSPFMVPPACCQYNRDDDGGGGGDNKAFSQTRIHVNLIHNTMNDTSNALYEMRFLPTICCECWASDLLELRIFATMISSDTKKMTFDIA